MFFEAFLHVLEDGETHPSKEVRKELAEYMNLTDEDLAGCSVGASEKSSFFKK